MNEFSFRIPGRVEVGFGKSEAVADFARERGLRRILLVVDHTLHQLGLSDPVKKSLQRENISFTVYDEIKAEPTIGEIDQAIAALNIAANFDGVIGIGGGSTIDVAKMLGAAPGIDQTVRKYVGTNLLTKPGLPTMIIPTTAGTGAEATTNAIFKDAVDQCKKGVVSPFLIPHLAVLDPGLTLSLPPRITAETGLDAFTHAIECFICNKANAMSDLFATEAMRLISVYLRRSVRDGSDKEARYNMLLASFYGGVAIANSGTGGVHALAYPLGGQYGLSHGLSNAILLAEVMEFNAVAIPARFAAVAKAMGLAVDDLSIEEAARTAVEEIRRLVSDVGVSLQDFTLTDLELDRLAEAALQVERLLANNPRPINFNDARLIYQKSLAS